MAGQRLAEVLGNGKVARNEFDKDPTEVFEIEIEWAAWLKGDTISSSTWTAPDGITSSGAATTGTVVSSNFSSGSSGSSYRVINKIVTAASRTKEAIVIINVLDSDL